MGDYTTYGDHGFVLYQGSFTTVDVPGAFSTNIRGITPRGDLVGYYNDGPTNHGFVRRQGTLITFDGPGATLTAALGINPRGVIVGYYVSGGLLHPFVAQ